MSIRRRDFMAGLAATFPVAAYAERVPRPPSREGRLAPSTASSIIEGFGISDKTGFVLVDLASGNVVESHNPTLELPPASVTKAVTALYAQAHLGNDHRFETRVIATGPVQDGVLQGDLYLVGGGDPQLNTDGLADLARGLSQAGVRAITGKFYVVGSALPELDAIDPSQPVQVGYNPGISGLNLNFNRVYFEWKKAGQQYRVTMDARTERYRPGVESAHMSIINRAAPTYSYSQARNVEEWTVSRQALGDGGGRWLPVRQPAIYAAEVFQVLAGGFGVNLPRAQSRNRHQGGTVIASFSSQSLRDIQRDMLRYSTNLTAEVLGLSASIAAGHAVQNLNGSAREMSRWVRQQARGAAPDLRNHSGLTDQSRISAQDMVALLAKPRSRQGLAGMLKPVQMVDGRGDAVDLPGVEVFAKTGTLNFTRGLAGYIEKNGQQKLGFAIFAADMRARRAANAAEERPRGARTWSRNAKTQEKALLYRWASTFGQL